MITNKEIHLRRLLSHTIEAQIDFKIALGASRFPCRIVALRLPEEAYQKRLKVLAEKKRKDPRTKINLADELHRWTILVTNLPVQTTPLILLQIYSIRWQIELFFKMMKNFMNLREILSSNPHRANISLYASMIAIVLLSLIVMATKAEEVSLYKAGKIFAKHIREFIGHLNSKTKCAVYWMTTLFAHSALKESRPNRPSTRKSLVLRPGNA